ncbi:hypothetical protein [Acrocarpospora catenulata]|uniref:hypothetical protein n=1 Tax=Acrocarpospora catenulata TaxID=2836182 RepID=UPI001BDA207D|nr:hypothetical protein [Acrocarpospora catenulata]
MADLDDFHQTVNRLLTTDNDPPTATCDWWLTPIACLGARPVDLLTRPCERDLIHATRTLIEAV